MHNKKYYICFYAKDCSNMKKIYFVILILLIAILNLQAQVLVTRPYPQFKRPNYPTKLKTEDERDAWMAEHYWDKFNFSNAANIQNPELKYPIISTYIVLQQSVSDSIAALNIANTLKKSKVNTEIYHFFTDTFLDLLGNPVSSYRNDEYLIPVFEELLSQDNLSDATRGNYELRLTMAKKNRIGRIASNFSFISSNEEEDSLHNIDANNLLIVFYSPECHACAQLFPTIINSQVITDHLANNSLKILAITPESEEMAWRKYQPNVPAGWINAYDPTFAIWHKRLYDIQGFPMLYLLDKNKTVILKDTDLRSIENVLTDENI